MENKLKIKTMITLFFLVIALGLPLKNAEILEKNKISKLYSISKIPYLIILLIQDNKIAHFSLSEPYKDYRTKASSKTPFEIGSTSKAFTALALLKLESEGKVNLNDPILKYLPWFKPSFKGSEQEVLVRHALHHTSGIAWNTISDIPDINSPMALEETVRLFSNLELKHKPGTQFEYATINYDILGLIIEKVSGLSYEKYTEENIFKPLGMNDTSIGVPQNNDLMAKGYKIGFFAPREYDAPVYKGNWPAGYVITNAEDMSKWLKFQMGISRDSILTPLLKLSHQRDETVAPDQYSMTSYAAGWMISLKGDGKITHGGLNPNFTSYIAFNPEKKIGVAVLANSNSEYTDIIGDYVFQVLSGVENPKPKVAVNKDDTTYSLFSILLGVVTLSILFFIASVIYGVYRKKRQYEALNLKKMIIICSGIVFVIPILYGIYLIPHAVAGFSWESAIVWSPVSFLVFIILLITSIVLALIALFLSLIFPSKKKYLKSMPLVIVLSLLSGLANSAVIFLIINSVASNVEFKYMVYYFVLAVVIYIFGRKIIQTKLLSLTYDIIADIRIDLIEKIFSSSYQKFEKIERGKIYATLNNDTAVLGNSANLIVTLITSVITVICVFIYLGSISLVATLLSLLVIGSVATLYYFVSKKAEKYFNEARETQNVYMSLLHGMVDGFKELSINRFKKREYKKDIESTVELFKSNNSIAGIKFINTFLIGESLLVIILGFVAFGFPKLFPDVQDVVLMSFLMVFLYMIGPINGILNSIPGMIQLKVSWERIQEFVKGVPSTHDLLDISNSGMNCKKVSSLKLESVEYQYPDQGEHERFKVGVIDLEVKSGEILFIVGGNGSGKTTLANIITGLYKPDKGVIKIDDTEVGNADLGEHFSVVFSENNLFGKLYNIDTDKNEDLIKEYFKKFYLEEKVKLSNGAFSTTKLSNGQRKRLALIKCFLENSPIYLFDEVAADQDPDFKRYFYKELLQQMKKEGKIIIAITHDDHYFDVADKILKLDEGKVEFIKTNKKD